MTTEVVETRLEDSQTEAKGNHSEDATLDDIEYLPYTTEEYLYPLADLIQKGLSEPYSLFTYREFVNNYPDLNFVVKHKPSGEIIGGVIAKLEPSTFGNHRVYIGMLIVDDKFRGRNIGSTLVRLVMRAAVARDADSVTIETEVTNTAALALYEKLGFVRSQKMLKYYMNGNDAYMLKFWLKNP